MRPASAAMAIGCGGEVSAPRPAVRPGLRATTRIATRIDADLQREWVGLSATASEPNPFAEPWFVDPSLRRLASTPVRLVEVRDGADLVGVILLAEEPHYGRIPVAHVENWTHHHLFLGTPAVRAGEEERFWRAVLAELDSSDQSPGFLHLVGLVEEGPVHRGLAAAAGALGRSSPIVHREQRALLQSDLNARNYYEATVRKKKRKELARLQNRLAELGSVTCREWTSTDDLNPWLDSFLTLERSGWKGQEGSALGCRPDTEAFFRDAVHGAATADRLQFLSLDLDEEPVAMLVNFITPPGAFSFKTTFDEAFARFSPGVLIQLENLKILDRADIAWMDSCAASEHPMIDSLWAQRRSIVRVTVPLSGARRRLAFTFARTLEEAAAARRRLVSRRQRDEAPA